MSLPFRGSLKGSRLWSQIEMRKRVTEILNVIAQLAGLVFVVGSMLAMGLSLTVPQIIQPLKNARLVILALVANFILVPALAYGLTAIIPVSEGQRIAFTCCLRQPVRHSCPSWPRQPKVIGLYPWA